MFVFKLLIFGLGGLYVCLGWVLGFVILLLVWVDDSGVVCFLGFGLRCGCRVFMVGMHACGLLFGVLVWALLFWFWLVLASTSRGWFWCLFRSWFIRLGWGCFCRWFAVLVWLVVWICFVPAFWVLIGFDFGWI